MKVKQATEFMQSLKPVMPVIDISGTGEPVTLYKLTGVKMKPMVLQLRDEVWEKALQKINKDGVAISILTIDVEESLAKEHEINRLKIVMTIFEDEKSTWRRKKNKLYIQMNEREAKVNRMVLNEYSESGSHPELGMIRRLLKAFDRALK